MNFHTIFITMLLLICFSSFGYSTEQIFLYHTDPAGTPLSMTDSTGTVVWKADYKPFGEEYAVTGSATNVKRFVGKEKDEETGLSYFGARYEDARIGRFTAIDPVRAVDPATSKTNKKLLLNPQYLNVYAYGLNNPYRYVDLDGREPVLRELMSRVVSNEAFIRIGEAIGASQLNAALTGYDFRGNEYSGFDRVGQLGFALISAPVTMGKVENEAIEHINPRNLTPTQTRSEMSGSQVERLAKDMKVSGYDPSKPISASRNEAGRLEIQDGHHRAQAAIKAGLNKVPVKIKENQ